MSSRVSAQRLIALLIAATAAFWSVGFVAPASAAITGGGLTVSGTIVDQDEAVVDGATIKLTQTYGDPAVTESSTTTTDADGEFTLTDVYQGEAILEVSAAGYTSESSPITIAGPGDLGFATLQEQGSVTGTVTDSDDLPIEGVDIELSTEGDTDPYTATTDEDGTYTVEGVDAGEYTLDATSNNPAYLDGSDGPIEVLAGEATTADLQLDDSPRSTVSGNVIKAKEDAEDADVPIENVTVTATDTTDDSIVFEDVTDAEGAFSMDVYTDGVYDITLDLGGEGKYVVDLEENPVTVDEDADLGAIQAIFLDAPENMFSDISDDPQSPNYSIFAEEIMWMKAFGISTGFTNTGGNSIYVPRKPVTRDAMAAFLFRLVGDVDDIPDEPIFTDVTPENSQFYDEIQWMGAMGYSTGYVVDGKRVYKPLEPIHRDAMAAFLFRISGVDEADVDTDTPVFADVTESSNRFYTEIQWMGQSGISRGYDVAGEKNAYGPLRNTLRDAMAAFIYRFAQLADQQP